MPINEVKMAKSALKDALLFRPNIVGLGVGYKQRAGRETSELSVVVMVRHKIPSISLAPGEMIPPVVDGVRTDVIEVGTIRALEARTERIRPVPGGVSIGHQRVTAGTLGCVVWDQTSGSRLILSNNHVLANRNDAQPGDPILQPGPADGGSPAKDVIALLERFERIEYNEEPAACAIANTYAKIGNTLARWLGSRHRLSVHQYQPYAANLIDAAVARPIIEENLLLDEILEIGAVSESTEAELGMEVKKSGRTTALTTGTVNILDSTVTVNYGSDRTAIFDHQIVSTPMSQGGDSGSLLVTSETNKAVGLLFAGSSQATLYNPIQSVLSTMRVDFIVKAPKNFSNRRAVLEKAQAVKEAYQYILLSKANVEGVGVGPMQKEGRRTGEIGLIVFVQQKLPDIMLAPEDRIPEEIEGVPVEVRETGKFTAQ